MARILIAGCGYVGTALALRLLDGGHEVHGLRRRASILPAGVVPIAADLADPASLGALPRKLDYVVYTAAPDGPGDNAYRAVYIDGLRNLLQALQVGLL